MTSFGRLVSDSALQPDQDGTVATVTVCLLQQWHRAMEVPS